VPAVQGDDVPIVGELRTFAADLAPAGWLECNGGSVSQSTYNALYLIIGTTWGPASGGNFTLPDFRRKSAVGRGGTSTSQLGNAIGAVGGAETIGLVSAEMPSHAHYLNTGNPGANVYFIGDPLTGTETYLGTGNATLYTDIVTGTEGGNTPHNNYHPAAVVKVMIYAGV
jgi:microcystin-dependent protein